MVVWIFYIALFSLAFADSRKKQQEEAIGRNPLDGYDVTTFDGECFTSGPIRFADQLNEHKCTVVNGDLTFEPDAGETNIKLPITRVRGCIFIEKTNFTDVDFIVNAQTSCGVRNQIIENPNLCMEDWKQNMLRKKGFKVDIKLNDCPSCLSLGSVPKCRTFLMDIDYASFLIEEKGELDRLKVIYGRLTIKDTKFPTEPIKPKIILLAGKGPEAALIIKNTTIPIEENILDVKIETFGHVAISMEAIPGYRFPRHLYLRLQKQIKDKGLDIETEGRDECYLNYSDPTPRAISSILDCKFIYGRFNVFTEGYSPIAKWMYLESREDMILTEMAGSDLSRIVAHVKRIDLHDDKKFIVRFDEKVCYKSDVMSRIQSMMQKGQKYKVRHEPNTSCTEYLGFVNVAAVIVEVCADTIPVPKFIFKVDITSFRDDDVLVRINGPGYKMEAEKYKILEKKYGKKRLDIDPMIDGGKSEWLNYIQSMFSDCYFKNAITDLKDLDNCERIVGNLVITGPVKNKVSTIIRHISGCVHIVNSDIESIDFIQFDIPYSLDVCLTCYGDDPDKTFAIKNNSKLCANEWMFGVDKHRVTNNKEGCGNNISQIAYQTRNYAFYSEFNNTENHYLHEVKELHGRIIFAFTNEETIDVFANLQSIVYLGPGPAIIIENNPKLKSLNFSSLRRITVRKGGIALELRNNPELKISEQQNSTFKKATDGRIDVITPEQIEEEEEMSPTWKGFWIAFGAGLGVLAGIAIIFAAVVVTVKLVKSRKSKKSTKNKKIKEKGGKKEKLNGAEEKPKKSAVSPAVDNKKAKK